MDEIVLDTIIFDYLTRNQKALSAAARKRISQDDTVDLSVAIVREAECLSSSSPLCKPL